MPNHVTTVIKADPEVIAGFTRTVTAQEQYESHMKSVTELPGFYRERPLSDFEDRRIVDFEMVVPSPPNKETGNCSGFHEAGVVCWLTWNRSNWGTKWGAYSAVLDMRTDRAEFDTAWSHPFPVIQALSIKFPDHPIDVVYADEDFGYNLGDYTILNGKIIRSASIVEGSIEAYELAAQVKYERPYAELREEWDEEEILSTRRYLFTQRVSDERDISYSEAHQVIKSEGLQIPQDIVDAIATIDDVREADL